MGITSINPSTGETIATYSPLTSGEIEQAISLGQRTFEQYRKTEVEQRSEWMHRAADGLTAQKAALGRLMTLEMGKPLKSAIAEVEKCAWVCRYYADESADFLRDEPAKTDASESYVRFLPLGVLLAVMPWNFPLWQVFRAAAPALMAGNTMLLKHASNVPQCAIAIEAIFSEAGFPKGAFQTLLIGAAQVEPVLADARVKAVTLTGSGPAGAAVAATAAKHIKKSLLELGGSDPFVVTASADLVGAIAAAKTARLLNNGQSCIAAKRFILVGAITDAFEQGLADAFAVQKVGDPLDEDVDIGPLATPGILEELDQQVKTCLAMGATALVGGDVAVLKAQLAARLQAGNFYPPTVLAAIPPGTPADQEEFFGPVALVFRVADVDEAIALANSTDFGLGASAWTTDAAEQERFINELDAGAVFINGLVKSDPRMPFGGIKQSGYGRELGRYGLLEFVNAKTVWIK
ncbi:MAG: NADP-dependent succinic semialdehyde dehydrogenase [Leptolyngbya foveolarum]|uniref:NADP-dependent succinic semialdehyde dehydrogenase n=1 Tax=Leptolyngbya foveolarum TaxID=47253 RepID=A0A2W4UDK4_9CYAN|nr:MAG: NADP-dependent succinic semialdehyde dehydrogenase [Leptolyngbya foveolarum]